MGNVEYNEGNTRGGDPREVLDKQVLGKFGLRTEDYLEVFGKHPTSRIRGR